MPSRAFEYSQLNTIVSEFPERYFGPSSSDPTTRSNGDALQAGDLYFNSSLGFMKVYDGASWVSAADDNVLKSDVSDTIETSFGIFSNSIAYAASVNIDLSVRNTFNISLTGNITINNPTGLPTSSDDFEFKIKFIADSNGPYTISLDTHFVDGIGNPTLSVPASGIAIMKCELIDTNRWAYSWAEYA